MRKRTMRGMFGWLVTAMVMLAFILTPTVVGAANTAVVEITATGSYVSITNSNATWAMGTISNQTDYWWNGGSVDPGWPLADSNCTSTINNTGSVDVDITIQGTNFTGGTQWTLAAAGGADEVALKVGTSGVTDELNMTTINGTAGQSLTTGLTWNGTTTIMWEMMIESPTSFTDGEAKSANVTLTAAI